MESFLLFGVVFFLRGIVVIGKSIARQIIQDLLKRSWRAELALIQRDANSVADGMAKHAIRHGVQYAEWLSPSDDFRLLLDKDVVH
ncbi:hypothetical protein PIB30_025137 [Stylosanthes scabra]|uniref:RNase H type-1 domain-containing protein n=1 Tax=Stylosanthes scabra TaxID=79078 RepID=A0ABU6W9I8_9FABA|nr:hypothetical protein [Stylosanthes scabra]